MTDNPTACLDTEEALACWRRGEGRRMDDLSEAVVGTKLYITTSSYGRGYIASVERITPSGRVITKNGITFERSGRKRGGGDRWQRTRARIATEDDIAGIWRDGLVEKFRGFKWDKLTAEELKAVDEIVARHQAA